VSAGAQSEGRRIAVNSALLGAGDAVAMALGFFTTLLVTDRLGADYGTFLGAQKFVALFLVFANFGLTPLMVRSIAASPDKAGPLFGTVFAMRLGLCAIFAGLVGAGSLVSNYLPEHRPVLLAFVVLNVFGVLATTLTALFEGLERMGRSALVNLIRALSTLVAVVAVVASSGDLYSIVGAYVGASLLQLVAASLMIRGLPQFPKPSIEFDRVKPLLYQALPFVAIGFAFAAVRSFDVILLGWLAEKEDASQYGAAINFVDVMLIVPMLVQRALLPAFSRLDAAGNAGAVTRDSLQVFSALLVPSAVGLCLLAESVVALYPSGEFAEAAPVLRVLGVSLIFLGPSSVCATYLTGVGRLSHILWAYALVLPLEVVACVLLIPVAGAVGAAVAALVAHASLALILLARVQLIGAPVPWLAMGKHLLAATVMGVAVFVLRSVALPVPVAVGVVTYFIVLLMISDRESPERRMLASLGERIGWR